MQHPAGKLDELGRLMLRRACRPVHVKEGRAHPDRIVETASLAAVHPPKARAHCLHGLAQRCRCPGAGKVTDAVRCYSRATSTTWRTA